MEDEIEINFKLDGEGRTTLSSSERNEATNLDYTTKACATRLFPLVEDNKKGSGGHEAIESGSELYDEILLDCEIADSGLMPRTFWVPADDNAFQPRFNLEQIARDIFCHHTARMPAGSFDPAMSGAEWWVQLRPSPETGRYSMHALPNNCDSDDNASELERTGITFHWDKDEDLRLLCGGTTYVHPHLSTVTYFTAIGAPTLVAEGFRIHNLTGEWRPPETADAAAFLSWPHTGKHLSFDGRYLHAAPSDFRSLVPLRSSVNCHSMVVMKGN